MTLLLRCSVTHLGHTQTFCGQVVGIASRRLARRRLAHDARIKLSADYSRPLSLIRSSWNTVAPVSCRDRRPKLHEDRFPRQDESHVDKTRKSRLMREPRHAFSSSPANYAAGVGSVSSSSAPASNRNRELQAAPNAHNIWGEREINSTLK